MFDTNFTITLSGYTSPNLPLKYNLYGVTDKEISEKRL